MSKKDEKSQSRLKKKVDEYPKETYPTLKETNWKPSKLDVDKMAVGTENRRKKGATDTKDRRAELKVPPKSPLPAKAEAPSKCPHCGAVLTRSQRDLKASGTKVICSECFKMV